MRAVMKGSASRVAFLASLSAFALLAPSSCTEFPERQKAPVDCAAGDAYEIDPDGIGDFEAEECQWYGVEDKTGTVSCDSPTALTEPDNIHVETVVSLGGSMPTSAEVPNGFCDGPRYSQANIACEEIAEGPRCGSGNALHLTAERNNDWGGFFGNYAIAQAPRSIAGWEGLAFWARAEAATERAFTIELDDKYTANVVDDFGQPDPVYESGCVDEEQQGTAQVTNTSGVSQSSGQVAGWVPSENGCGNPYQYHLNITNSWKLYLIPFRDFSQQPWPNRRLEGFDAESFRGLRIRPPKDAIVDLWIDDFGFYRAR